MPIDYNEALERVMLLADFERSTHSPGHAAFHLERMHLLLSLLGNPHLDTAAVHIAGTDGKGSTAAMVTAVLEAAGYSVGLYTSPHLHSLTERIRIGFTPIGRCEFAALVDQVWPAAKNVAENSRYGELTTFEFLTALAFTHFLKVGVDFQVIEVGLGGRLDATNVIQPSICAITRINKDHIAILGDSLEEIAIEKAGIIKPATPVVVAPQPPEVWGVIRSVAQKRGAPFIDVQNKMHWENRVTGVDSQTFHIDSLNDSYDLTLPLMGEHQMDNAAASVAVTETMANLKVATIKSEHIVAGLKNVQWPGRMQMLCYRGRRVLVDGAHNPSAARRLVEAIRKYYRYNRTVLIIGGLAGHSIGGLIDELVGLDPGVVVAVKTRHPRSVSSAEVAEAMRKKGLRKVMNLDTVWDGLVHAIKTSEERDLVVASGSLSVVAEVIEGIEGISPEIYPRFNHN